MSNEFISGLWFWGIYAMVFVGWVALIRYATKRINKPED